VKLTSWQASLILCCLFAVPIWFWFNNHYGGWRPPANPDPSEILKEAESDTAAGKYADALTKHIWFHQNALKYRHEI
jgi:hypothetical protein